MNFRTPGRLYAEVIGDPIAHSKSPLIHGFWLAALGLDADYRAARVAPADLSAYFADRRADPDWRGCNVTIPHKLAALDHVEDRGDVRATIGAINLAMRAEDGALIGANTDAGGFYAPIAGFDFSGKPVVVIGAGGAARAVLFALAKMDVGPVTVLNRTPLKGAALLSTFGLKGRALPLTAALPPAALLVNAGALGMTGQPSLDLDLSPLPDDAVVYDLVYAPLETDLLAQANDRGLETVDGLEMLVAQAALAFELLFGVEPPRERDDELRELLTA
ncbi:shikimate dehydrogenase family protein [uncultured Sphingomonas sp.]|uniref:shikimate dehydrogenase family protein n=1 Tax=uncultured Sphingomonas sp. TaxID=158754 RepID=UPI0035CAE0A9